MRRLDTAPATAVDPDTGRPRFGSYRGEVVDDAIAQLERSWARRLVRHKRWIYACAAVDGVYVALAVVDLGYAANAFVVAYRDGDGIVFDRSVVGLPGLASVVRDGRSRVRARLVHPRARFAIDWPRDASTLTADARLGPCRLHLRLDADQAPAAMTAIAPIAGGRVDVTEKRALLRSHGTLELDGRSISLDGGLGGIDYTHGLLARHTSWRWAFFLGATTAGKRIGLNLVEGFVGEPECTLFLDDGPHGLAEGRFSWSRDDPMQPWHVTTADDAVDLRFTPGAMHAERRNLGLVRSRFVQPVGTFRGTIRHGDEVHAIDGALGVVEDQDVLW